MKKHRCFLLKIFLLLVLPSGLYAQIDITGTVTAPDGVTPLDGIYVTVYQAHPQWGYWQQNYDVYAYTDVNGEYRLEGLSPGVYRIGFRDWDDDYVSEYYENASSVNDAMDVVAGEGETVAGIDASLAVASIITGRVTGKDGDGPLENIDARAFSWNGSYWEYVNGRYTDANGDYSLGGLPAGTYRMEFRDWDSVYLSEVYNSAPDLDSGVDIVVGEGETIPGIDASLEKGGVVEGVLLDSEGTPVAGMDVSVRLWNSTYGFWMWAGSTTTDSSGAYEVNGLRTGSYRVVFSDYDYNFAHQVYGNPEFSTDPGTGQSISVTAGETTTLLEVSLRRLGSVSGTVVSADDNLPVSGVKVRLIDGSSSSHIYEYDWQRGEADTDSNGAFTISRVVEGSYHAIALTNSISENLLPEWHDGTWHYALPGGEPVPVDTSAFTVDEGENVQGVDFSLNTGSEVSGHVTGAGGIPLEGVVLTYLLENSEYRFSVTTDLNGAYTRNKIFPGTYLRKVAANSFKDEWYPGVGHKDQAEGYEIPPNTALVGESIDLQPGQSPALVEVQSDPAGASVYLNFQPTGEITPVTLDLGQIEGLNSASHVVTVWKVDTPRPSPKTVPAVEAETVELLFDLVDPAAGTISIDSSPSGATVYVDAADVTEGMTPVTVGNLAPGSHVILLKKDGYLQPRPVIAWVEADSTTVVNVPLTPNSEPGLHTQVSSAPPGMEVLVNYVPSGEVTDVVVAIMDPASHSGAGWQSASHTVMLRHAQWGTGAPRYVDENTLQVHENVVFADAEDLSGSGLPDQWEIAYDLAALAPEGEEGPDGDADGDGISNRDEMIAGTNPLDAGSKVQVNDLKVEKIGASDMITMTFRTVPGRSYVVQTTSNLVGQWQNISGVVTATSTSTTFILTIPPDTEPKFYRLLILRQ